LVSACGSAGASWGTGSSASGAGSFASGAGSSASGGCAGWTSSAICSIGAAIGCSASLATQEVRVSTATIIKMNIFIEFFIFFYLLCFFMGGLTNFSNLLEEKCRKK
jgi:hypothetical protein